MVFQKFSMKYVSGLTSAYKVSIWEESLLAFPSLCFY